MVCIFVKTLSCSLNIIMKNNLQYARNGVQLTVLLTAHRGEVIFMLNEPKLKLCL